MRAGSRIPTRKRQDSAPDPSSFSNRNYEITKTAFPIQPPLVCVALLNCFSIVKRPGSCRASNLRRRSSVYLAPYFLMYFRKIIGPRPLCLMLIKFSAYRARQSSVFFSFSSVISFKMRINTEESVLVGGSGHVAHSALH